MASAKNEVSAVTLDQIPSRVLNFIRMVRRHPVLWNLLAMRGYGMVHHQAAWDALRRVVGAAAPPSNGKTSIDPPVAAAEGQVIRWDEEWLPIIRVVWEFDHPEQFTYMFGDGLKPVTGAGESLVVVGLALDRLDALQSGEGRTPEQRAQDQRALAELETYGLTADVRRQVRTQLTIVETSPPPPPVDPALAAQLEAEQYDAELQLYRWWKRWSTIARLVVTRTDHLQWLGLAERKRSEREGETTTS